jgi:hypothetical protein
MYYNSEKCRKFVSQRYNDMEVKVFNITAISKGVVLPEFEGEKRNGICSISRLDRENAPFERFTYMVLSDSASSLAELTKLIAELAAEYKAAEYEN